jgi:signal transduction histidine kinase
MAKAAKRIQATGRPNPVAGAERHDELGVLARAFNDMTDRLVSTNATLAAANTSLAEAVRARDEFISVASHELKTPITPLALRVQQLLRVVRDSPDGAVPRDKLIHATRNLDGHVVKLAKLIENLLDVSTINSGQLTLRREEFSLCDAVRDALDRVAGELSAAHCDVQVDSPRDVIVRADRSRIEQVLVNLIGNAAKHAPGAPVVVRLAADAGVATAEIEDAGQGIIPDDQERIFERFERAVADRHVSGLGLGLYIAREIVRAHGGELSVRSESGRGATFVMRLRRDPAPQS